jgi:spore maturation protein CgeB
MKKCLDIKTKNIKTNDIIWGVLENGYECDQMWIDCGTNDLSEADCAKVKEYIAKIRADIVITMDFCPTISKACYEMGVPYASWIYDVPVKALYHREVFRDTNFFFVFDKKLLTSMIGRGIKNASYLPLAANVTRMGKLDITERDNARLARDISFVGVQYTDVKRNYETLELSQTQRSEFDKVAENMLGIWDGEDRVNHSLSDRILAELSETRDIDEGYDVPKRLYYEEYLIPRTVAFHERQLMMEMLAYYNPTWYGSGASETDLIDGVEYKPRLTYEDELPKAYYLSKINLSTTLHSITSGVPMRVFDITGAGGFVITNYQPELDELFEVGEEIVVYHDFEEMEEKVIYYLRHEDERTRILVNGYKRVSSDYTYRVAIKKIMDTVFSSGIKL